MCTKQNLSMKNKTSNIPMYLWNPGLLCFLSTSIWPQDFLFLDKQDWKSKTTIQVADKTFFPRTKGNLENIYDSFERQAGGTEGDSLDYARRGITHTFNAKFSDQISRLTICTCEMADLREPFELCRVLQNGSLIGISRHAGGDNVLITFRDRGVLAYNVSNNNAFVQMF